MKTLTPAGIQAAAAAIDVTPRHIRTVAAVESSGSAFESDKPIIRFEPHIFQRLTRHRFDKSHPRLSHTYAQRKQYKHPTGQEDRWRLQFGEAAALDREAAIQACSYGMFQVMGFNYRLCGYKTPQDFLNGMFRSADEQLMAMVRFCKAVGIDDELRRCDWAGFAKVYNGPAYADAPGRENDYDVKLAREWARAA